MRKGKDKGKRNVQILMACFIVFLMVFSVIAMWGGESESGYVEYDGYDFYNIDSRWATYVGDKQIVIMNNPSNLSYVTVEGLDSLKYADYGKVYFTFAPDVDFRTALYSISANAGDYFPSLSNMACYEDGVGCESYPLKDCGDASNSVLIVKFVGGKEDKVVLKDDCLIIEGEDLNIPADRLVLDLVLE